MITGCSASLSSLPRLASAATAAALATLPPVSSIFRSCGKAFSGSLTKASPHLS